MKDALYGCYLRVGDPGPWAAPGRASSASRCRRGAAATPRSRRRSERLAAGLRVGSCTGTRGPR